MEGKRQGQIALFVLVGFVILLIVVLAIYWGNLKEAEVQTFEAGQEELLAQNPEVAAERLRMKERMDACLEETLSEAIAEYEELGSLPDSEEQLVAFLEEGVGLYLTDCLFAWPINGRLSVVGEATPAVTVSLGAENAFVTASLPLAGEYDDVRYTLNEYEGRVATGILPEYQKLNDVREQVLANNGEQAKKLFSNDCGVDPYGLTDEGIYADVLMLDDGSSVIWLYDYSAYEDCGEEAPRAQAIRLPPCQPGENAPRFT